jgi:RNA binding exosome subunit
MEFSSVTISFFIHATEEATRLLELVNNKLRLEEGELTEEKITGYFGNEIVSIRAHLIGPRAKIVSVGIIESLSDQARNSIRAELDRSLDEHDALYLRLDRQSLGDTKISLSDEEPIRIKLKPKNRLGGREIMKLEYEKLIG